jgi:putative ABC transport system permease protein
MGRRGRNEEDFAREVKAHLALEIDRLIRDGMSQEDARLAALRAFGSVTRTEERFYESRRIMWLSHARQDIRYALRTLIKSPGFAFACILTLALGVGANTALFSVVNAVLLAPLPYTEPDRLVQVWMRFTGVGLTRDEGHVSALEFRDMSTLNRSFARMAVYDTASFNLSGSGTPERIEGALVSPELFPLLDVRPLLGRTFVSEEGQPGRNNVVLLSHGLWQRRFGGDATVVGRVLRLNEQPFIAIGVLPATFRFPDAADAEILAPLAFGSEHFAPSSRGNHHLRVLGRLEQAVSLEQARADMEAVAERIIEQNPDFPYRKYDFGIIVKPLLEQRVGDLRIGLWVLMAAVGCVLLIACTNIAGLLLVRASARGPELAIRGALGADRYRLVGQLLMESLLLAGLGGLAGVLIGHWGTRTLAGLVSNTLPRVGDAALHGPVLVFAVLITLATGLFFGVMPALQASRAVDFQRLRYGLRWSTADASVHRVRQWLVIGEVALSLTLLVGAGLLVRSFVKLLDVDPGFRPERVLTLQVELTGKRYDAPEEVRGFFREVIQRVRALPGIEAAGSVSSLPLSGGPSGTVTLDTRAVPIDGAAPDADLRTVMPGYFEAMGIPLLRGRYIDPRDTEQSPLVAMIDETMAEAFWPGEDPIGKRLRRGLPSTSSPWMTIVGVVRHVRNGSLESPSRVQVYWPHLQQAGRSASIVVRASGDAVALANSVRQQVLAVDPERPVFRIRTMEDVMAGALAPRRLAVLLSGLLAGVAVLLAAGGIYGVMAHAVSQRMHEFGIRLALGANRSGILHLVLRQGMTLAGAGCALGLAGALMLRRAITTLVYDIDPADPITIGSVLLLLLAVAFLASYIPARRATDVDPVSALRSE